MNTDRFLSVHQHTLMLNVLFASIVLALAGASADVGAATQNEGALKGETIAYVLTDRHWAIVESDGGKKECPKGFNDGPREQFAKLFPGDPKKYTLLETQLKREGEQWHPSTTPERFPFYEAQGSVAYGMNLDGKVDSQDFESPDGTKGIDNQLYRVIGCIANYRAAGTIYHFENEYMRRYDNNRWIIELSGVQSLTTDSDVTVTAYRGLDSLLTDATGNDIIPGGTQRVDARWGKQYIKQFKGKIVDGVLTTSPVDIMIPWAITFDTNHFQVFRGLQLQLKLTEDGAQGVMAGFANVDAFIHHLNVAWATHHQSYGQQSSPSQYRAMHRLADAYPDPKTGVNTAISSAAQVKFAQVFLEHPVKEMLSRK